MKVNYDQPIQLQQELKLKQKLKVQLTSVGNPDHGQDPNRSVCGVPKETVLVNSMEEASQVCMDYIDEYNLGGGNWIGGQISAEKENSKVIAMVCYNGRVVTVD